MMKIMTTTSQSMRITLKKTKMMIMKTTMMTMIMMTTITMMKIMTMMKTTMTTMITEVVDVEETEAITEIRIETAREDLLPVAEVVPVTDQVEEEVRIQEDPVPGQAQGQAEEEDHQIQEALLTAAAMTEDMIIREDPKAVEAAEEMVAARETEVVAVMEAEDHQIQEDQEAVEETPVLVQAQAQDQETMAVQVEAQIQDLVTEIQKEASHR